MSEPLKDLTASLAAARGGSQAALGDALEKLRAYLLAIAERELDPNLHAKGGASDLVQETLMDALRDFGHFQGGTEEEFKAWLRRLLLHNLVDFTRLYRETGKRNIRCEVALNTDTPSPGTAPTMTQPSPSGEAIRDEEAEAVRRALDRLPEDYRRVIQLRYQEERSFEDIGRLMNLTPNAARKLWVRAFKRLQQETEGGP
jgi:RNA polymerase sigma-70 factor (ECF subfamily)